MKLPRNWNEIDIITFQELIECENDLTMETIIEKVSILLDEPTEDIEQFDLDKLYDIWYKVSWIMRPPNNNIESEINGFIKKKINDLTLGEYIDIDTWISENPVKNLHLICAVFWRKYKQDEWDNTIIEPYKYDVIERSNFFLKQPISNHFGIIEEFNNFKNNIIDSNSGLFLDLEEPEDTQGLDEDEINEIKKEIEDEKKKSKFSWSSIIWQFSNENASEAYKILDLPYIFVMNLLAMRQALK
jgi:hypothetical protein